VARRNSRSKPCLGCQSVSSFPFEVDEIVRKHFMVMEWKVQHGTLTYVVGDEDTKERFVRLYFELEERGYVLVLRSENGRKVLRIFKRRRELPRYSPLWSVVLLLVTMATRGFGRLSVYSRRGLQHH